MLSTPQKWPPPYVVFLAYFLLTLVQWPASYWIRQHSLTWGILVNEWLFVAGLGLLAAWRWQTPLAILFPFKKVGPKSLLWTIVMTLALVIIIDDLTFLSEKIWPLPPEVQSMLDHIMTVETFGKRTWRWFLICLTPAFCEELFFRGFFQNTLAHHWGKNTAFILTAIAFAFIHGIPQYWHLYFLLGFYLSWLLWMNQNLWLPILAHLLNNSWTYFTHLAGFKIPRGESWQAVDSFLLVVCVIVFWLAANAVTHRVKRNA